MNHFFFNRFILLPAVVFLLGICGCAGVMESMPAPPDMLVKIELKGPYDKEIPEKYVTQLKGSSLVADWAIPYIFISVGMYFESSGDEIRALHFFDRAIKEFRNRQDATGEGTALNRKVFALYEFGKIQDAYSAIKDAEQLWTNTPLNAFVYHNYGHYYLMNGDYNRALDYFRRSFQSNVNYRDDFNLLMLRRDSEFECGIAVILADYFPAMSKKFSLLDFDEVLYEAIRKNVDEGIAHLQQVIILNEEIKKTKIGKFTPADVFQVMESNVYNFLGLACGIKGQVKEALQYLDTSSQLAVKANFRIGEVDSIFFRNQVYLLEKNITEGQKVAGQLNELADKYHLPFYQIWAKFILSRYHLGFGDSPRAVTLLNDAIAIMEKQRSGLVIDTLKETYMFNRQVLYEALMELLAKEGDFKKAFETAERAKSRVLVDLLAGKDIGKTPVEEELIKQNNNYVNDIAHGYRKLMSTGSGGDLVSKKILEKITQAEAGHRDVIIRIKGQNEELYSLVSVEPPDIEAVRQLLDINTTLFSYYVTDKLLYIWAVNKDSVHLERVKITGEAVRELVSSFNTAITAKNKRQIKILSEKIYDTFLKPVIPFVKGDRIGFIPHKALYYLPFVAMSYKGKYLVEGFSIFCLPGAGVLKYIMKKQPAQGMNVLAFGNPDLGNKQLDLPYAEAEVKTIKNIMPRADVYTRDEATKNKVSTMMANYDFVHFATHGHFMEDAPMSSGLLLAAGGQDDGRLTAMEIFKLQFKGRAVVLSACKTALGLSSTGTEIMGLNRAFLYAGSPSVVATLWNIEDQSTALFMETFYKKLKKNENIADALKGTQIEMIRLGYEPYTWAAFTLTGKY
ncbi:MAG: CHAT domain protein [Smithella sp. PtaU1.Bin162]|nr:MAG: CHAT domain protein [Smithella sp. PtaU1.Bin162]